MATIRASGPGGRRAVRAVGVLACACAAFLPARAERIDLDLYEKIALAPLVVRGEVEGEPQRFARVRVLEVLRGEYEAPRLEIAFRLINFERPWWQDKISFREGEEALLFLVPMQGSRREEARGDRFILFKGPEGKVTLPAEGRQAWLDASRRLAALSGIAEPRDLFDSLRALTADPNPLLVEVGLRQVRKHDLADERLVPTLLEIVKRPEGRFRAEALDLAADLIEKPAGGGRPLAARDHLVSLASLLADEAPEVATRRAAVRVLASDGTPAARAKLQAISEADPSQDVRYEAAVAAYRLSLSAPLALPAP